MTARANRPMTLTAHWLGEAPLASAYWLGGWLGWLAAYFLFLLVIRFDRSLLVFGMALLLGYSLFACVAIWRCWRNSSSIVWGYLARAHVIAGIVLVFLVVVAILGGQTPV